jgi:hypothetical protein
MFTATFPDMLADMPADLSADARHTFIARRKKQLLAFAKKNGMPQDEVVDRHVYLDDMQGGFGFNA